MIKDFWLIIVLVITFSLIGTLSVRANEVINEKELNNEEIVLEKQEKTKNIESKESDEIKKTETGKVIVHYYDESGNSLKADYTLEGPIGEAYEVFSVEIKDYALKEIKGSTSGKYQTEDTSITFIYAKDSITIIDTKEYTEPKEVEESDPSDEMETDGVFLSMGAFEDIENIPSDFENPNTSDNISIYFQICFTSLLLISSLFILKRKLAC